MNQCMKRVIQLAVNNVHQDSNLFDVVFMKNNVIITEGVKNVLSEEKHHKEDIPVIYLGFTMYYSLENWPMFVIRQYIMRKYRMFTMRYLWDDATDVG